MEIPDFSSFALRNRLLKFALWRLAQPLFNRQDVFEFELVRADELSPSAKQLPAGITVRLFHGEGEIRRVAAKLERAGVPAAVVEQRMKRGDLVALALADEELAAYTWTTFADVWIKEVRRTLPLHSDEAVQFDTLVMPKWRGKDLQYAVTVPVLRYLSEQGYRRTLSWVNALNTRSIKNQLRQGKRRIATIASSPVLRIVRLRNISLGASVTLKKRNGR